MKHHLLLASLLFPLNAFAQGSLTPPAGAPAPSMRTLEEIHTAVVAATDPRIPINATTCPPNASYTHVISAPGSYFLPANLTGAGSKGGIQISAANVTLDLNGFTVAGAGGSTGINATGANTTIKNGSIKTWTTAGVSASADGVTVSNLKVSEVTGTGILLNGAHCLVDTCVASKVKTGIQAAGNGSICRSSSAFDIDSDAETYGIWGCVVVDCSVTDLVSTAAPSNALTAAINGDTISNSTVFGPISGAGSTYYIYGETVDGCHIQTYTAPAASTKSCSGISAKIVSRCSIDQYIANSSTIVIGIEGSRVVDCVVQSVTNSGAGAANGIQAGLLATTPTRGSFVTSAVVTGCIVSGIKSTGIYTNGAATVTGCKVSNSGGSGIEIGLGSVRDNQTSNNVVGIRILSNGIATGNYSQSDTTPYILGATVRSGPVVTTGGTGTTFDVNSNFAF